MLKKEKGAPITDEFIESFGKLYNGLKIAGLISMDIKFAICGLLDVSNTTYYTYLRKARDCKVVTDTYEDCTREFRKRARGDRDMKVSDKGLLDIIKK